ncbi:hypothetical protein SELMODRAFT_417098 [Selaginella moellendorffii]|uniref:FCP1 homology domain-containing protein n=1 Tax=Selaginella moellendorffii TaxID=88036 RepID=D8S1C7_SELML|nr:hypothetical protein SELMODRAFT_417098 [Selaginella moellendorffii]
MAAWQERWGRSSVPFPWEDLNLPSIELSLELSNHEQRLKSLPSLVTQAGSCKTYGMVVEHLCARNTLLPPQDAVLEGRMTVALDLDNTLISFTSLLRRSQCDFEVRDDGSPSASRSDRISTSSWTPWRCLPRLCYSARPPTQLALSSSWILVGLASGGASGRDLRKVVLVDDDPGFFCQPGSGNEIVNGKFTGQRSDDGLLKLLPVLQSLAQLDDVRPAVCTYQQPQAQGNNSSLVLDLKASMVLVFYVVVRGQALKRTWRMAVEDKYSRKLFSR